MKKIFIFLASMLFVGCVGPLYMNLEKKKNPPPVMQGVPYTIVGGRSNEAERFYWVAQPTWGHEFHARDSEEARRKRGYWHTRYSMNEPIIWVKKVTGNFMMKDCFWEPADAWQGVKEPDGKFGTVVSVSAGSSRQHYTMDCKYFDNVKPNN